MATPFRAAHRRDGRGDWRIDIEGRLELVVRDKEFAAKNDVEVGQVLDFPTKVAEQFKDWESNG
jgi:hypothetical protein